MRNLVDVHRQWTPIKYGFHSSPSEEHYSLIYGIENPTAAEEISLFTI